MRDTERVKKRLNFALSTPIYGTRSEDTSTHSLLQMEKELELEEELLRFRKEREEREQRTKMLETKKMEEMDERRRRMQRIDTKLQKTEEEIRKTTQKLHSSPIHTLASLNERIQQLQNNLASLKSKQGLKKFHLEFKN